MSLQHQKTKDVVEEKWFDERKQHWTVSYYPTPCLVVSSLNNYFYYNQCEQEAEELIFYRDLSPGLREKCVLTSGSAKIWRNDDCPGDYAPQSWVLCTGPIKLYPTL